MMQQSLLISDEWNLRNIIAQLTNRAKFVSTKEFSSELIRLLLNFQPRKTFHNAPKSRFNLRLSSRNPLQI